MKNELVEEFLNDFPLSFDEVKEAMKFDFESEAARILAEVEADPLCREAKLSPEESDEIWKNIQKEIRKIESQN